MSTRHKKSSGFTLMELMLGLAITALVAGAAGAMLICSSNVFRSSDSAQSAELMAERLVARLGGTLSSCRRVGAINTDATGFNITCWCQDNNSDGVPQLSEMAVVKWTSATQQLTVYQQKLAGGAPDATVTQAQMDSTTYAAAFMALSTCISFPIATGTGGVKLTSLSASVRETHGLANTLNLSGTVQAGSGTANFYQTETLHCSIQY